MRLEFGRGVLKIYMRVVGRACNGVGEWGDDFRLGKTELLVRFEYNENDLVKWKE